MSRLNQAQTTSVGSGSCVRGDTLDRSPVHHIGLTHRDKQKTNWLSCYGRNNSMIDDWERNQTGLWLNDSAVQEKGGIHQTIPETFREYGNFSQFQLCAIVRANSSMV